MIIPRGGLSEVCIHSLTVGISKRRTLLLVGTSLALCGALASPTYAQNECGPPPPGGGTVTCSPAGNPYPGGIDYDPPGGVIGSIFAKLFGEEPSQQIEEDLGRFKQVMEAGETPTTEGQSSGRSAQAGR